MVKRLAVTFLMTVLMTTLILNVSAQYTIPETGMAAPDEWALAEIKEANELELLTPNTATYYKMAINRFEFAELIVNSVEKLLNTEINPAPATTFEDIDMECVLKAYAAGIVKGIGENLYDPLSNITRQEIATMMYRAILYVEKEKGVELIAHKGDVERFADKSDVSNWAEESVATLAENEIMKGTSETTLSPLSETTIQEAVLLVLRIYKLIN